MIFIKSFFVKREHLKKNEFENILFKPCRSSYLSAYQYNRDWKLVNLQIQDLPYRILLWNYIEKKK